MSGSQRGGNRGGGDRRGGRDDRRGGQGADKTAAARKVGELVAERAKAAGISAVVFDRGGDKYHGRLAALADAARENGLDF